MYLSTLRNMIMAMGGTLDLVARFPEGSVKIKQFADLDGVFIEAEKLMEAGTSGEAVSA